MSIFSTLVPWVSTDKSPAKYPTDAALQQLTAADLLCIALSLISASATSRLREAIAVPSFPILYQE